MLDTKDFLILLIAFNASMFLGYCIFLFKRNRRILKDKQTDNDVVYYVSFFVDGDKHTSTVEGMNSHKKGNITSDELQKEFKTLVKLELELDVDDFSWTELYNPKNYFVRFISDDGTTGTTNVLSNE